jgi:hypothetical protein
MMVNHKPANCCFYEDAYRLQLSVINALKLIIELSLLYHKLNYTIYYFHFCHPQKKKKKKKKKKKIIFANIDYLLTVAMKKFS